jgi:hypothetical protein
LLAALLPMLGSCADASAAVAPRPEALLARAVFIALEHDFAGFRSWHTFEVDGVKAQGTTHPAGN